jgi:hypothetical protein
MTTVISVRDVEDAATRGEARLAVPRGAVVTPSARDRARDLHVILSEVEGSVAPRVATGRGSFVVPPQDDMERAKGASTGSAGTIQGRIVGTPEIQAAIEAGLRTVSVASGTWVTRAARHLAEQSGLAITNDGQTDGTLVNPLQQGGATTRSGPGVVHEGGTPIGGDHDSGTLPKVPLPKARSTRSPSTWSNTP